MNCEGNIIHLTDALNMMDEADRWGKYLPFSISFVKFNRSTGVGGELVHLPNAVKVGRAFKKGGQKPVPGAPASEEKKKISRNPNHSQNMTRNIQVPGKEDVIKIHIRLITRFNDMEVRW